MNVTVGTEALKTSQSGRDAVVVSNLKSAGAIVLGKANMAFFAMSGYVSRSENGRTICPDFHASRNVVLTITYFSFKTF